jgi:hypothetical protein
METVTAGRAGGNRSPAGSCGGDPVGPSRRDGVLSPGRSLREVHRLVSNGLIPDGPDPSGHAPRGGSYLMGGASEMWRTVTTTV